MSTLTTNYKLTKPDVNDFYNINVQNANMDAIDAELKKSADHMSNTSNPHGVTAAQVGALPIINATSSNYNMDEILVSGSHYAWYKTNNNTLGTPYKYGATMFAEALILSFGSSTTYAIQWAFLSGNTILTRSLAKGEKSNWTTAFLPLNGGTMSGNLVIENNVTPRVICKDSSVNRSSQMKLDSYWGATTITTEGDNDNWSGLYLHPEKNGYRSDLNSAVQLLRSTDGVLSTYNVFGSHNKTSGSYTGDGSATTRTVDTKGLSNVCVVWSGYGFVIATSKGGLYCSSSGNVYIPPSEFTFIDGVFTIASTNNGINKNDTKYYYQVL